MAPILEDIKAKVDEVLEEESSIKIINQLEINITDYYYILKYGLTKYGLKQHQIRPYIRRLIEKERENWSCETGRNIVLDVGARVVKEVNGR